MHYQYGKQLILFLASLCCISSVFAANTAPTGGTSNAIAFAVQAGQIAGSAQGCGINISTFTTRVSEAINKLALNPTDSSAAISTFQQSLQQAQIVQRNNNPIPCSQVMQDFNNLPLLRPDYEQSVIAQLTPGMDNNNQPTNTQQGNTNNPATMTGQAGTQNQQQNLSNQPMPNTAGTNQNVAGSNNQQNTNNPAYPQQNYGPMKSFSTNYPGAVKSYGMANMQDKTQQNQNTGQQQQQYNNPPPPNFSNPNNAPPANSGYPNQ